MKVRANADTPLDARTARSFGAEGIGLCRTEHMFFEGERIVAVREMILADDEEGRARRARQAAADAARRTSSSCSRSCGLPVTIRLLDPPLHEFLPHTDAEIAEVAEGDGRPGRQAARRAPTSCTSSTRCSASAAAAWRSPIPRSPRCRRARSSRRAVEASRKTGAPVIAGDHDPADRRHGRSSTWSRRSSSPRPRRSPRRPASRCPITVGTMIELPRAALQAGEIAETRRVLLVRHQRPDPDHVRHLRDDAATFLGIYTQKGMLPADPFVTHRQTASAS